jgi:hypothetical protein
VGIGSWKPGVELRDVIRGARWLVVGAILLAACSDLRVKVEVYDNVDEARAAGAVAAGWVPDALPRSTGDLHAGHLPDGRYWGVFTFARADEPAVRALVGSEVTSGTLTCDPPRRLEWWPRIVQSPVDVNQVRSTGFQVYRGADARNYVVNWGQGRAYYWR